MFLYLHLHTSKRSEHAKKLFGHSPELKLSEHYIVMSSANMLNTTVKGRTSFSLGIMKLTDDTYLLV